MRRFTVPLAALISLAAVTGPKAAGEDNLPPYQLLRSMQYVQDSVVAGDHSAAEMQRYMLGTIDKRLRTADPTVFDDPRNIDAALIYAMSGGNPATLEYLAAHDVEGYFDNRVSDLLRKYLSGKGQLISRELAEVADEYADKPIGPYLALVTGNTLTSAKPEEALKYYDWARLTAPGTIVEEAALRRSMSIAISARLPEKALNYARIYARRFLHSPYAAQFADMMVTIALDDGPTLGTEKIADALEGMEPDRQREIWLRIARRAAIKGESELALFSSQKAGALTPGPAERPALVASLYDHLARVSSGDPEAIVAGIDSIPDSALSPRDLALKEAARAIAADIVRQPDPASLTQGSDSNQDPGLNDGHDSTAAAGDAGQDPAAPAPDQGGAATAGGTDAGTPPAGGELDGFVASSRSKLDAIDQLLGKDAQSQ